MKAITYDEASQGTTFEVQDDPARPAGPGRGGAAATCSRPSPSSTSSCSTATCTSSPCTVEDIRRALRKGDARRARSSPVLCGSAFQNKGVQPLLDAVVDYLPSPLDMPPVAGPHARHLAAT